MKAAIFARKTATNIRPFRRESSKVLQFVSLLLSILIELHPYLCSNDSLALWNSGCLGHRGHQLCWRLLVPASPETILPKNPHVSHRAGDWNTHWHGLLAPDPTGEEVLNPETGACELILKCNFPL